MAESGTAGYVGGGNTSSQTVDKFAFSDDSRTTLGTGLSIVQQGPMACADSGTL
jgi:hypothetical protein